MTETATTSTGRHEARSQLRCDETVWRARIATSDIADELFLPAEHGEWRKGRWRVRKAERREARTRITGCRLLEADPARENLAPEREVQTDFRRLVVSVARLRQEAAFAGCALSRETMRTGTRKVPRLRYGLVREPWVEDETKAAGACHARIDRSIRRAGFRIVAPEEKYDRATGFAGLTDWADQLLLRRRRPWWPWLLPLLLLSLVLLALRNCSPLEAFFGVRIETRSLLLIVDRSSSMQKHFATLRSEGKRVLRAIRDRGASHADIISFAGDAMSCLGEIGELNDANVAKLERFLDDLRAGGGTRLASAMVIAAREVKAHGRPTTLVILTDAQDGSIREMLARAPEVLASFGDVKIIPTALTPRLFGEGGDSTPLDGTERACSELMERLGGYFGSTTKPATETTK